MKVPQYGMALPCFAGPHGGRIRLRNQLHEDMRELA